MFIGISGTICSGKKEVLRYLAYDKAFGIIWLDPNKDLEHQHLISQISTMNNYNASLSNNFDINVNSVYFSSVSEIVEFITPRWRENFVIAGISTMEQLEPLLKRPFFLHISVDAPVLTRWQRYNLKLEEQNLDHPIPIEEFVQLSDELLYNGLATVIHNSKVKLINKSNDLTELHKHLGDLNLLDNARLRPSWDLYFMQLADLAAHRSNCMKRRVGCVLVRENRVIATGYNGTPRGISNCNEGGCERCNSGNGSGGALSTCLCLHAEENALLEAGRERIGTGGVIYCNTCPCLTCSVKIVQCGIKEVVYSQGYSMDQSSADVLRNGGVSLRKFLPSRDGIIIA